MESQPQNPEFRINPENFYPCKNMGGVPEFRILRLTFHRKSASKC